MAIPKKGSRLITIDDMTFRWRVRRKPTCRQGNSWGPMTFAVELPGVSAAACWCRLPAPGGDAWWGERTMAVRPALMTATIRMALDRGWHPRRTDSAFELA